MWFANTEVKDDNFIFLFPYLLQKKTEIQQPKEVRPEILPYSCIEKILTENKKGIYHIKMIN